VPLPGEIEKAKPLHDNIIIACAPYPTNKPHDVLPRYLTRIQQVERPQAEGEEQNKTVINKNYKSYFEGVKFNVID